MNLIQTTLHTSNDSETTIHKRQRELLTPHCGNLHYLTTSEDSVSCQIDVPPYLSNYLMKVFEQCDVDCEPPYGKDLITFSLDYSYSYREVEDALSQAQVPHTIYTNDINDNWYKRDFRYVDDTYTVHTSSFDDEVMDIAQISTHLTHQSFAALAYQVETCLAKTTPFTFTEDDYRNSKKLMLTGMT